MYSVACGKRRGPIPNLGWSYDQRPATWANADEKRKDLVHDVHFSCIQRSKMQWAYFG